MEIERGFVVGASEDGIVYYRESKNEYGLEIDQNSLEWLEVVQKKLKRAYNKKSRIRKTTKGYFRLNVYSKELFSELSRYRKKPSLVLQESEEFQRGFLQGIFDAEGSVRKERRHLTVSSKRKETIRILKILLKEFGINIGKPNKDKNNVISIPFYGKENLKRFEKQIGFRHPAKNNRLRILLS